MKKLCMCLVLWLFSTWLLAKPNPPVVPDSLDIMIGQMICIGVGDVQVFAGDEPLVQAVSSQQIGGVVLYEKNLAPEETYLQLRQLIATLQLAAAIPLWIAIDEEGGKVNRLRPVYGFIPTLSAATLAQKGPAHTAHQAARMAEQLREVGINLNFAPVVDLAINPKNKVIVAAERSFGRNPVQVALHAAAFVRAHRVAGVTPVIKHFPGHGSSDVDTHMGTADVTTTWQKEECMPYKYLIAKDMAPAIMSAHIINARLDPDKYPATFSKPIMQGLLREELQYTGVVFSDDLHMQAITDHYTLEESIFLAVEAGVDVLLFSYNIAQQKRPYPTRPHALLRQLVEEKRITRTRIATSYRRIMALKAETLYQ